MSHRASARVAPRRSRARRARPNAVGPVCVYRAMRVASPLVVFVLATTLPSRAVAQDDRAQELLDRAVERLSVGEFDDAATLFEHVASVFPTQTGSDHALSQATHLRLALGERPEALSDVDAFWRRYGSSECDAASALTLAAWSGSSTRIMAILPVVERACSADARRLAHAALARALDRDGDRRGARAQYVAILSFDPRRGAAAAAASEDARDVVAEARFALAEEEREKVDAIMLAPFVLPSGTPRTEVRRLVLHYLDATAAPWVRRKRRALDLALAAYERVFGVAVTVAPPLPEPPPCAPGTICLRSSGGDPNATLLSAEDPLGPSWTRDPPSPRWAVAAAERIGAMFEAFAETTRALPVVPSPCLAASLNAQCVFYPEPAPKADADMARTAYEACLRMSTKYRVVDEAAARCERGLSRVAKAEAPPVDELRPLPTPGSRRAPARPLGAPHP